MAPAAPGPSPTGTPTPNPTSAAANKPRNPVARFVSENTNVVSSFVIGIAGLAVTSIYQCNQGELQRRQAEAQMKIARQQADNSWRIERAKILSENLKTLTARGGETVEQRYGVLLSLLRGSILEPDVAVSYALELGRDNPEYMRSVLANIDRKDEQHYTRLLGAYYPTCEQKWGISSPQMAQCQHDKWAHRSAALAATVADILEDLGRFDEPNSPMCLLVDERQVTANLLSLVGLFGPFLSDLYERRAWLLIEQFLARNKGARLVGTLALSVANNDFSTENEADRAFRKRLLELLSRYLEGVDCETECRLKIFGFLLTNLSKSHGLSETVLRQELLKPREKIEPLLVRFQTRLQACQYDPGDAVRIRDSLVLPLFEAEAQKTKTEPGRLEGLVDMLAELPEPMPPSPVWQKVLERLEKPTPGRLTKLLLEKRGQVQKARKQLLGPPKPTDPVKRRPSFCLSTDDDETEDDEE